MYGSKGNNLAGVAHWGDEVFMTEEYEQLGFCPTPSVR